MTKKLVIIRQNNVVFTELIDDELDLFDNQNTSLNSFIEDHKLFELNKNVEQIDKNRYEDSHISILKYNNEKLDDLLDELKSLRRVQYRTGELTYGASQLSVLKRKLAYLIKRKEEQVILDKIESDRKLFVNQDECSAFINYVLDKDIEFRDSDDDHKYSSHQNQYLKLNLKSERILIEIFKNLNVDYDCRPKAIYYLELFKLKLEPKFFESLIKIRREMRLIDNLMTQNLVQYNSLLEKYFKVLEKKLIIKLRSICNQGSLIESFRNEIRRMHLNNLGLANRINIFERNLKKLESKL